MTQRRDSEVKFGISLNFDESNNKVEVAGISDESLAGEKNRRLSEIPGAYSYALQPGDIIEAVNLQTEIEEIQRELQTARSHTYQSCPDERFQRIRYADCHRITVGLIERSFRHWRGTINKNSRGSTCP